MAARLVDQFQIVGQVQLRGVYKNLLEVKRGVRALRSVKAGPKCITRDTEVCESIAIIRKRIAIVRGD